MQPRGVATHKLRIAVLEHQVLQLSWFGVRDVFPVFYQFFSSLLSSAEGSALDSSVLTSSSALQVRWPRAHPYLVCSTMALMEMHRYAVGPDVWLSDRALVQRPPGPDSIHSSVDLPVLRLWALLSRISAQLEHPDFFPCRTSPHCR